MTVVMMMTMTTMTIMIIKITGLRLCVKIGMHFSIMHKLIVQSHCTMNFCQD